MIGRYGAYRTLILFTTIISVIVLLPLQVPFIEATSPTRSTQSQLTKPTILALDRENLAVNHDAVLRVFSTYLTNTDYIATSAGNLSDVSTLPGAKMLSAGSLTQLQNLATEYKTKVTWVVYDLE